MSEGPVCHVCGAEVYDIDVRCSKCGAALSSTGAQRMIGSVVLEQYEITDILGQGGMSVVYQGKHKLTGQEVALKVLPPELAAHRDVKNRFLEEGRALAQLDHPNIVHLYNFGDDGDCLVLAMQFVRGVTWERVIMDKGQMTWQRSAELARDVSNALDYAHGRGIIHRDMKPSNVLLRDLDGAATVMDFGIAKMQSSSKLTATGQTMGTVRYMSPEQVRGKEVDERTDIYSLAMTTYESIVGDTPFTGETHFEIMTKHLNEVPVPPSQRGVDIPPALEAVLMKAIAKRPEDRQSSAREFKEQLEAVLAGAGVRGILEVGKSSGTPPGNTGATPLDAAAFARTMQASRSPTLVTGAKRGKGMILLAFVVVCAGTATYVFTRKAADEKSDVVEPVKVVANEPSAPTTEQVLADAFQLPGLSFSVDKSFTDDALRILSVDAVDTEELRAVVRTARVAYQELGAEEGWAPERETLPLSLVIVPPSVLCNPQLYESQEAPERCQEHDAWYRPREHSLYLAKRKEGSMAEQIGYWVAVATCIHSGIADCADVIASKLGQ